MQVRAQAVQRGDFAAQLLDRPVRLLIRFNKFLKFEVRRSVRASARRLAPPPGRAPPRYRELCAARARGRQRAADTWLRRRSGGAVTPGVFRESGSLPRVARLRDRRLARRDVFRAPRPFRGGSMRIPTLFLCFALVFARGVSVFLYFLGFNWFSYTFGRN